MKDITQTGLPAQGWHGSLNLGTHRDDHDIAWQYHSWSRKDKKVMGEYKTCYVKIPNCRPSGKLWTFLAACFNGKGDMQKELVTWARYVAIFHPSDIIRITSFFLRWTQHHFKGCCCSYWILGTLRWEISRQFFATGLSFSGGTKCNKEFQDRHWAQFQWAIYGKWNNYFTINYRDPISQLMGYRQGWVTYLNRNIACFEGIREPESWVEMRGVR